MDVEQIKSLIELMGENDLTEIKICEGEKRIVLRRGSAHGHAGMIAAPALMSAPVAAPALASAPAPAPAPAAEPAGAKLLEIKAPMVGTFYSAADPDSPPFVRPGSPVGADTVVCIIEAMKVFNEIKAECSGTIERMLVENGGPVEFGQVLFLVRPN